MTEREAILGQLIRSYRVLEKTAHDMGDVEKEKHCRESAELCSCQLLGYPRKEREEVQKEMPKSNTLWVPEKECDVGCGGKCSGCH
jgi:hypothetical protein